MKSKRVTAPHSSYNADLTSICLFDEESMKKVIVRLVNSVLDRNFSFWSYELE